MRRIALSPRFPRLPAKTERYIESLEKIITHAIEFLKLSDYNKTGWLSTAHTLPVGILQVPGRSLEVRIEVGLFPDGIDWSSWDAEENKITIALGDSFEWLDVRARLLHETYHAFTIEKTPSVPDNVNPSHAEFDLEAYACLDREIEAEGCRFGYELRHCNPKERKKVLAWLRLDSAERKKCLLMNGTPPSLDCLYWKYWMKHPEIDERIRQQILNEIVSFKVTIKTNAKSDTILKQNP